MALRDGTNGPAPLFVGRQHSYHGNSIFALSLGDHPRKMCLEYSISWVKQSVGRFDAFMPWKDSTGEASIASLRRILNDEFRTTGRRCVVVMETIGGTTIGVAPPSATYLAAIRSLCNQYKAILIYDEVLSGNYRLGYLTAWQAYQKISMLNCAPDIVILGKGITGGYFPMSAVVCSSSMRDILVSSNLPTLWHTSTNQNHPIGCAAVVAAIGLYEEMSHVWVSLAWEMQLAAEKIAKAPGVVRVSGAGCLYGIQLEPEWIGLHKIVKTKLLKRGVSTYTDGATIHGQGNMLLFAPPLITQRQSLDAITDAIIAVTTGEKGPVTGERDTAVIGGPPDMDPRLSPKPL